METTETKKSELSTAETTENPGTYIGDFLAQDVFHFCNVKWPGEMPFDKKKQGIVFKLRSIQKVNSAFCWPGAICPAAWLAYRGMVAPAFIASFISMVYFFITNLTITYFFSDHPIAYVFFLLVSIGIFTLIMGTRTIKMYYRRVIKRLDTFGLRNRANVPNEELDKILQKQGKPSVLRGILIPLTVYMTKACIADILFTLAHLFL